MPSSLNHSSIQIAIAWCLAWGTHRDPQHPNQIKSWRTALSQGKLPESSEWKQAMTQSEAIAQLSEQPSLDEIVALATQHPALGERTIGLIYGGVTKVKSYVFESADLQEIRGGSALLDRINLVDLPALFHAENSVHHTGDPSEESNLYDLCREAPSYCDDVRKNVFASTTEAAAVETDTLSVADALIPELIVYSTGGNILAFCPAAFVTELCNTIEKRYTTETLTANSCAVGDTFRPIELYVGLLQDTIEKTYWHDKLVADHKSNKALQAYFGLDDETSHEDIKEAFFQRKNFGELVGKLTSQFNQRRSGDDSVIHRGERPSRRYPPMFETHPYLVRDSSDIRSIVKEIDAELLPNTPKLSEPTARKRHVGQLTKRDDSGGSWYADDFLAHWNPRPDRAGGITLQGDITFKSWVSRFEDFLRDEELVDKYDPSRNLFDSQDDVREIHKREARSLTEIGASSNGYVGYIYADGNSMGKYIREQIKTPERYQAFSQDIFEATKDSVYNALVDHIHPYHYQPDGKSSREATDSVWIHPFEIVTIGGDDVLLVVPANKAIEVAHAIGEHFERILLAKGDRYADSPLSIEQKQKIHRCRPETASEVRCQLSTSSGVLITAGNTPFYYALNLVTQLQKSAKKYLKALADDGYKGGTVDFLVLKAVTMITSDIAAFRKSGLTLEPKNRSHKLKLQAAPYTLHDISGLIKTVQAIKDANFPKSQLYQIRSLLERGKRTAILNYRYFRARLQQDKDRQLLQREFEEAWCAANTNGGNLAPWLPPKPKKSSDPASAKKTNKPKDKTVYETIWRELVELEPFIEASEDDNSDSNDDSDSTVATATQSTQEAS